jgi:hypothetical protein
MKVHLLTICIIVALTPYTGIRSAEAQDNVYFSPKPDSLHKSRLNTTIALGTTLYSTGSLALYEAWYSNYPGGKFHWHDDRNNWLYMDKAGHLFTAYFQASWAYQTAKWTGLSEKTSVASAMFCGGVFQTTLELMDGFSEGWGFSAADMGANLAGLGIFYAQQKWWKEQKIKIKLSYIPARYPDITITDESGQYQTTMLIRANTLFGSHWTERLLKDYNQQNYWISFHPELITGQIPFWPEWLHIGLGYSAQNLFGAQKNQWKDNNITYSLPAENYPRTGQFFISPDIDLSKLKIRNQTARTICHIFNIFKLPLPAIGIDTKGNITFHLFK